MTNLLHTMNRISFYLQAINKSVDKEKPSAAVKKDLNEALDELQDLLLALDEKVNGKP